MWVLGIEPQVLWKSSQVLLTTGPSLQPAIVFLKGTLLMFCFFQSGSQINCVYLLSALFKGSNRYAHLDFSFLLA